MNLSLLLEMSADGLGDAVAFGPEAGPGSLSHTGLLERSRRAAAWVSARAGQHVGLIDVNSLAVPILLYGSAMAGKPFVPINYRLTDEQLRTIFGRIAPAVVVADSAVVERVGAVDGIELVSREEFLAAMEEEAPRSASSSPDAPAARAAPTAQSGASPDDIAILLFTSGTTGEPKAAVLRQKHLVSYVISTVEFMGAVGDEAGQTALISVPPYHIAGVSAVLTSVYAGRRVVQLPAFDPAAWVSTARDERVTHAMVVPTMLGRILDVLEREGESLPALRALSYGGGRMPIPVIERAMRQLPHVDFVNAYGLTETSSTIAVLDPEDHRVAWASHDPKVRARLGSVGRPLPTLELEIRDIDGNALTAGQPGEIWVRGEQVSGEYLGGPAVPEGGWFRTHDAGMLDDDGYLHIEGRLDDVIVRGGENMSPGEIEEVLLSHRSVADAAVVGLPDTEWGEKVVAAVVPGEGETVTVEELQDWVRARLRSSKTPDRIEFRSQLPYTETGKLLRRVLRADLQG
jgi:acyl-CoA synthetase (AMP-forming)/AMP-acid ligase II